MSDSKFNAADEALFREFLEWKRSQEKPATANAVRRVVVASKKERVSAFTITINSNQTDEKWGPILVAAWKKLQSDLFPYILHSDGNGRWPKYVKDESKNSLISKARCDPFAVERGDQGRVHIGPVVRIWHQSNIQLSRSALQDEMMRLTGLPYRPHINLRGANAVANANPLVVAPGESIDYARMKAYAVKTVNAVPNGAPAQRQ